MISVSLSKLSLSEPEPDEHAFARWPSGIHLRIAQHLRDTMGSANPQADLVALALTCKRLLDVIVPNVLYSHLQIPSLGSLYSLESTLGLNVDNAQAVKVLSLSPEFLDWYQYDVDGVLCQHVKYNGRGSVPCPLRLSFLGPTTERSLVMAWLTTLAQLCPNLVGVDLRPTNNLTKSLTIGFGNLAQVLRPRAGWFKSPSHERLPVSSILVHASPTGTKGPRHCVPYLVTDIDWGQKILDVENVPNGVDLQEINICQIDTIIPGGSKELADWRIRDMKIFNFGEDESSVSTSQMRYLGLDTLSFVFNLEKQRIPSLSRASSQQRTSALSSAMPAKSKSATSSKGKRGNRRRLNKKSTASSSSTAVSTTLTTTQASRFEGSVSLHTGPPHLAFDILDKYQADRSQCVDIRSSITSPVDTMDFMSLFVSRNLSNAFEKHFLTPLVSSPWLSVARLDIGFPLFTAANYSVSLEYLAPLARAFPNVTTLLLRLTEASIPDALISVDPFVRRHPDIGPPLRELAILRHHLGFGKCMTWDPPVTGFKRTRLDAAKPTRGHLRELVFEMTPDSLEESSHWLRTVVLHPGIAVGLETLNATGIRIGIAPSAFADPDGPSFPSPRRLNEADEKPIPLGRCTFPNLRHLHFLSVVELGPDPFPGTLFKTMPTCPKLESLILNADEYPFLADIFQIMTILRKYPRLRNAAIFPTELLDTWLVDLYMHLFVSRPLPHLIRLIVYNEADRNFPEKAAPGAWSIGRSGAKRLSDMPVPDEAFKLVPTLMPNNDWIRAKGDLAAQRAVFVPQLNRACKCGKHAMGKAWRPDSEVRAWVHPGDPKGQLVVCSECVRSAVKERLRVEVHGQMVDVDGVRRIADVRKMHELYSKLGSAIWGLRI